MNKSFIVFILLITITVNAQILIEDDHVTIHSEYWSFWKKYGDFTFTRVDTNTSTTTEIKIDWVQRCNSFSPYDIYFKQNDKVFARTDGRVFSIGTRIKFRDAQDNVVGYMKEDIITAFFSPSVYSVFHLYNDKEEEVAISEKVELFSTDIKIMDLEDNVIATTTQTFRNKLGQSFFGDGKLSVTFMNRDNYFTKNETRYLTMMALSTKAIADLQRDEKGNVSGSSCQFFYFILVIVLPIIAIIVLGFFLFNFFKYNSCTDCCNCCKRFKRNVSL